jgi:hypothetical protein
MGQIYLTSYSLPLTMESKRWFKPAKNVLLTGAGFSRDFGGYLAAEMWAVIFRQPEIRQYPNLRKRMLEGLDYEVFYHNVLSSESYRAEEKGSLTKAIRNAYHEMHELICEPDLRRNNGAAAVCRAFIARFDGSGHERGFFFTLNQDLFLERFFSLGYQQASLLKLPGLEHPKWFNGQLPSSLSDEDLVRLPDESRLETFKSNFWSKSVERFAYVKLHGSYGWRSQDGSDVMVIGHGKLGSIEQEPLLKWYLSLFEQILRQPERKLVVVGYGFGDEHINNVIADAIRDCGLRLYVISPKLPSEFREMLTPLNSFVTGPPIPRGADLWEGLYGYYRARATEFCDENGQLTTQGRAFFHDIES